MVVKLRRGVIVGPGTRLPREGEHETKEEDVG